jgi:hypothetical protein
MIFAPPLHRVIEHVDRRVLGAFQLVDAVTGLPVAITAKIDVRSAALVNGGQPADVPLQERSVQLRQNRSGFHVIERAPFFDDYCSSFVDPQDPDETPPGTRLRLRLALRNAGPHYLPREFEFNLPRSVDPEEDDNVFEPAIVPLFRAPGAPVLGGWCVLRVRVTQEITDAPLPGVLVRVFRSPRGPADPAIGQGMTEWRDDLRGEALVAVADLPRFRPGQGNNVFETTQAIHLEATRDPNFTGAAGQFPDIPGNTPGVITRRSDPSPDPVLAVEPPAPFDLRAGSEMTVHLTMP